jgi:hypothetical protein
MRTFSFYIHDVRHTLPTLAFVTVSDEQRAREIARERLMESPDHLAIEVREDDGLLFSLDRNGALWTDHAAREPRSASALSDGTSPQ